nr:EOG090X0KWJ [Cyclestheria hislopi]
MSSMAVILVNSRYSTIFQIHNVWSLCLKAAYAKQAGVPSLGKKSSKLGPVVEKKKLPVETDPEKLTNFVCGSNIYKQGQDLQLKEDSEYPDWLWKLRLGKPPSLEEMDPETLDYWRRLRKLSLRRQTQLMGLRKY